MGYSALRVSGRKHQPESSAGGAKRHPKGLTTVVHVLFAIFACLVVSIAYGSTKKGVGLADLDAAARIEALNVAWYYTWQPVGMEGVTNAQFVPMVWGGHRLERHLSKLRSNGKIPTLLAFNEPDKPDQANMSVDAVIYHWRTLERIAGRLSTPAPAEALEPWFRRFYREARQRGLKMDFMAVHIYSPPDPEMFLAELDAVFEKFKKPIWLTEFAVADWDAAGKPGSNRYSEDQVLEFMKIVLPELEKRSFVKRYAWFGAGNYSTHREALRTSRLFDAKGNLTRLGGYYAEFSPTGKQKRDTE